jgi:antagonist of KipI
MTAGEVLEVVDGGLLTTVQDRGRPGWAGSGVPHGGACDPWSLAVANVGCGNAPDAPALELTLVPPTLRVLRAATLGLAGADLGLRLRRAGAERPFLPGSAIHVADGDILTPGPPSGTGARAYLAVAGGIDVPRVLGSASTALGAGFGGLDGRALRAGDRLAAGPLATHTHHAAPHAVPPIVEGVAGATPPFLVLPGPFRGRPGDAELRQAFLHATWRVGAASDRMGLRLDGPPLAPVDMTDIPSHGVTWGTIQLPPDGRPIVLLADHQPTGGYPVIAVVIAAERPRLGQLRPGADVRFEETTPGAAIEALRAQQTRLRALIAAAGDARRWDAAADAAGG